LARFPDVEQSDSPKEAVTVFQDVAAFQVFQQKNQQTATEFFLFGFLNWLALLRHLHFDWVWQHPSPSAVASYGVRVGVVQAAQ
jgi:hypothetical protein